MAQEGQKAARRACRRGTTADSCCTDEATQARERGVNKGKEQEENTKAKRSKAKNKQTYFSLICELFNFRAMERAQKLIELKVFNSTNLCVNISIVFDETLNNFILTVSA